MQTLTVLWFLLFIASAVFVLYIPARNEVMIWRENKKGRGGVAESYRFKDH